MEQWKDIPGYVGRYQISDKGRVRSLQFKGKPRQPPLIIKPTLRADGVMMVCLTDDNKSQQKHVLPRLMAVTWLGLPKGSELFAYCKNGDNTDFSLENIGIATRAERCCAVIRRPVRKVLRETGEVVAVYSSVREAAKQNYMCYANMMDCLHGRRKRPQKYIYEYADDKGMRGRT